MSASSQLVAVAVSGPFHRAFTYRLPEDLPEPALGQRLLVEFGRSRKMGFFVGRTDHRPDGEIKPILKLLDAESNFPDDLYRTAVWMAGYYFANVADCLAASLPPGLKSARSVELWWGERPHESFPQALDGLYRLGKRLNPEARKLFAALPASVRTSLIRNGGIVERWPSAAKRAASVVVAYEIGDAAAWESFFRRRKFRPEQFAGRKSRKELVEVGWTPHYLREATNAGLLKPVLASEEGGVLDFVVPKEGVTELPLTEGQKVVYGAMAARLGDGFSCTLLHGITGSGKTLVYCHLAREAVSRGQAVLILTPEIALSGTMLAYLRGFFGHSVTVIHSAMTDRERMDSWRGIRSGRFQIVVGPRSAVFAPLDDLGLVIVDEEHDGSYKQDDQAPRFHGRDTAVMRGKLAGVPVLLGSASPSLESYHHARSGHYHHLELRERPAGAKLPVVRLVDMRKNRLTGDQPFLSLPLKKDVEKHLQSGHQVILFLNRRGYSPQIKCADCGHVPSCPHCEIRLTYHRSGGKLACHYCGFVAPAPDKCPSCSGRRLMFPGAGTQKVEQQIPMLFPEAKALRFDSDTARGRSSGHRMLHQFARREHNLLLGTQMVTKGLDLPGVSLVGVLSADSGLDFPDFRAAEKTFARLLQVAGRCGRGADPGEVIIQTFCPENEVIADAARQDYVSFFEREVESRRLHGYPPFGRLTRFILSATDRVVAQAQAEHFTESLRKEITRAEVNASLLGPAPCPIDPLRGRYRRQLIARTTQQQKLIRLLSAWETRLARFGLPSAVRLVVDVDPDDMM